MTPSTFSKTSGKSTVASEIAWVFACRLGGRRSNPSSKKMGKTKQVGLENFDETNPPLRGDQVKNFLASPKT